MMTINPKREKCTPVSKVTSPVTQVAELAVKYESRKLVGVPRAEEMGSDRSIPPVRITRKKLIVITNGGRSLNIRELY
jgi:hypothetical protein